jgi:hypothetical protein
MIPAAEGSRPRYIPGSKIHFTGEMNGVLPESVSANVAGVALGGDFLASAVVGGDWTTTRVRLSQHWNPPNVEDLHDER